MEALKAHTGTNCHNPSQGEKKNKQTSPYAPRWYHQAYLGVSSNQHAQTLSNAAGHSVSVYNGRGGLSTMTHPKTPE